MSLAPWSTHGIIAIQTMAKIRDATNNQFKKKKSFENEKRTANSITWNTASRLWSIDVVYSGFYQMIKWETFWFRFASLILNHITVRNEKLRFCRKMCCTDILRKFQSWSTRSAGLLQNWSTHYSVVLQDHRELVKGCVIVNRKWKRLRLCLTRIFFWMIGLLTERLLKIGDKKNLLYLKLKRPAHSRRPPT